MITVMLFKSISNYLRPLLSTVNSQEIIVRYGHMRCTRNVCHRPKPKHRGIKRWDGQHVMGGCMLVKQRTLKFHPGMHVGLGRDGALYALLGGTVRYTCEIFNPNYEHTWVQQSYAGREGQLIYKKYINIVPEPQHFRYKLIDTV